MRVSTNTMVISRRQLLFNSISSFVGILAAVPLSLAFFSLMQPAQAQPQNQTSTNKDNYALYAEAYSKGYLASADAAQSTRTVTTTNTSSCADTSSTDDSTSEAAPAPTTVSTKASNKHLSESEWAATITNSYNTYATTTVNNTDNSNSNNTVNSNNTSTNNVSVKDSNGVVVNTGNVINGNNNAETKVLTNISKNDTTIKDSFNKDSHDTTKTRKNSHEETSHEDRPTIGHSHDQVKPHSKDEHISTISDEHKA